MIFKILSQMSKEINELGKWQPTIEVLSNKALKTRHWNDIKEITKASFNHKLLSLQHLLRLKINLKSMDVIADISDKAKKQNRLEDMLMSMEKEWRDQKFEIVKFRDTSIPIMQG